MKKDNVFKNIWQAITNFEKYKEFAFNKTSNVVKYAVILLLLFSVLVTVAMTVPVMKTIFGGVDYLKSDFPELNYENCVLKVDSETPIYLESDENLDAVAVIDTNATVEEQEKYLEEQKGHKTVILVLNDKLIVKTEALTAYTTYNYTQIQENFALQSFNKQDIIENFTGSNIYKVYGAIFLFLFAYMFLTYTAIIFIDSVILSILAFLVSWLYKIKLKYSNCIKLAVYALTLPLVLQLIYIYINTFTGFTIQYFAFMYDMISYIYIITAIIIMKNDLAKQDVGLVKEVKILPDDKEEIITNEEVEKEKDEKKKKESKKDKKKVDPNPQPGQA